MTPVISLIVLGFRNFETVTRNCLETLSPWFSDPRFEILLVDNGSPDDSAQKAAAWCELHPGVRWLPSPDNLGFAGGMNFGAAVARGRWLFLVNNDTLFPGGALDALVRVVERAPAEVAMIGPVTNAAGNGQRLLSQQLPTDRLLELGERLMREPSGHLMPTYRTDFFCVAIRRDAWDALGGLDRVFGLGYYEDFDFSLRLRAAGWQQVISEDVFILHVGSATFSGISDSQRVLLERNKRLLISRHPKARLEHLRMGNLAILEAYRELMRVGQWSPALSMRLEQRLTSLDADAPRSPLKRWLWKRKVANLRCELAQGAGLSA